MVFIYFRICFRSSKHIRSITTITALTSFARSTPSISPTENGKTDAVLTEYGVRNVYLDSSIHLAVYYAHHGILVVRAGTVAFFDGLGCKVYSGKVEWDGWCHAPVLVDPGLGLLWLSWLIDEA
jgi:hypothetical protein